MSSIYTPVYFLIAGLLRLYCVQENVSLTWSADFQVYLVKKLSAYLS